MIQFFMFPLSANARRVHIGLEETGIPYEAISVNLMTGEQKKPEFLAINPSGRVPAIKEGDFVLFESNAILFYLAEKSKKLMPSSWEQQAKVMQWMFFLSSHVNPSFSKPWFQLSFIPEEKRDQAGIAAAQAEAKHCLQILEPILGKHDYLAEEFSIADISLATAINLHTGGHIDIKPFPAVERWFDRVRARESWKKTEPKF
jgi:GST-like protein